LDAVHQLVEPTHARLPEKDEEGDVRPRRCGPSGDPFSRPRADRKSAPLVARRAPRYHVGMFTGLVEALGTVRRLDAAGAGRDLVVAEPGVAPQLAVGESVAVNGCCLTVVAHDAETMRFEVGPETLAKTNLGGLRPGDRVNLERSLRVGDRLGGHIVQG